MTNPSHAIGPATSLCDASSPATSRPRPQNIYDHPDFFEGYRTLRQNDTGLNGALEVPALRQLLPDLIDRNVLDLGCGFGDFARYARAHGARAVTAVDVSTKMIEEAKRLTDDAAIEFICSSIESLSVQPEKFDLVVSSMALHYVEDFKGAVQRIFDILKPGGCFIFSVEHPVCTANPEGWVRDQEGALLHWPLDRYQDEGKRSTSWFVDDVIKYHRTTESYIGNLLEVGFHLRHFAEPRPEEKFLKVRPWLAETLRRPPVLLLAAMKADVL